MKTLNQSTYLLLKHILGRPIAQLVSATERISKGDLNYRVPIKTKDEIGFLSVSFNKMTENLQETLKEIKAKGYEIKVLNALNEIITTASRHLNIENIVHPTLNVVIRSIGELAKEGGMNIKKVTGGLFLHDEKNGRLVLSAVQGISTKSLGCKGVVPTGECLCGLAASSGEIVFSPNCLANSRDITMPSPHPEKDHANISIPLMSGDKVTGILFLYLSPSGHQPGASEIAIFTSIGNYVGLNIDKATLYEQMQELAIQDGLTGLYNHREFQRYLEMEVNRTTRA